MDDTRQIPLTARLLIVMMAAAGAACAVVRFPGVVNWSGADLLAWAAMVAGITFTELYPINLRLSTQSMNFSVTEAVWVGGLILTRPSVLTLAVAAGVLLAQLIRRRPAYKVAFNVGQFLIALSAAQLIFIRLHPGSIFSSGAWIAAGVAMATYAVLNASLVALVIALVERQPFLTIIGPPLRVNALHFAANTAIGLEGALIWAVSPMALSLLLVPLILAHISYQTLVRALREGERARDLIIEHASDGIFLVAPAGRVLSWNPAMERITGFGEKEATGQNWIELLTLGDTGCGEGDGSATGSSNGQASKVQVPASLIRKDGTEAWVQYSCNAAKTGDGKVDVTVVVVHDVTAQRQTEQLKSDFVATISHELRTPLTPLKGFLSTLLQGTVEDTREARQEYYAIMLKQTNRLERLITDLLEVSRVESNTPLVSNQVVEVNSVVRQQMREFGEQQPDRVIRFEAPDHPVLINTDLSVLGLVLSNLISNALKYSPADSPVELIVSTEENHAVVSVRDRGMGIPLAEQAKIFDRFYQVESGHVRTSGGVGLGLYIARRLVAAMTGTLWVESEPGHGSTFSFRLPLASLPEPELTVLRTPLVGAAAG